MSNPPIALIDANVWFSRTLRDWICLIAIESEDGLYSIGWTEDILAELIYHLRRKHPMQADAQIGGVRDRIVGVCPNGRISGYLIDADVDHPDIFDAHVHAAAIHAHASYVVTDDRKGFRYDDDLPYEVYTADEFLVLVDDSHPISVDRALTEQLRYWCRRSPDGFDLVDALRQAGAKEFAKRINSKLVSLSPIGLARILT